MDKRAKEGQKMIRNNLLLLLTVMLILTPSCRETIGSKSKTLWNELLVKVTLNYFKNSSFTDSNKSSSLVYGSLDIRGKKKNIKMFNLDCIVLDIDGSKSEKIYVDSVAHILTSEYIANNNMISVDVYWKFNKPLPYSSFKKFDYVARFPEPHKCVSFK